MDKAFVLGVSAVYGNSVNAHDLTFDVNTVFAWVDTTFHNVMTNNARLNVLCDLEDYTHDIEDKIMNALIAYSLANFDPAFNVLAKRNIIFLSAISS